MDFKSLSNRITNSLLDDDFRQPFLVLIISALTAIICFISAVPHFIVDVFQNGEWVMAVILAVSFVLSLAIFLLTLFLRKYHSIWRHLFMVLFILLFGYCCWDGGPQGFIHLWLLLIPAFSFMSFGMVEGFITSIPAFFVMILFFWSPLSEFRKYNDLSTDFRLRMTLIYLVGLVLGFIAELLRHVAAKRLKYYNKHYEYVSLHDPLTNLANQNYLAKYLESIYEKKEEIRTLGCLFIDVDAFKSVNDKYGHLFGNTVLIKVAEVLAEEKNAFVCRWGGDEFVVCFTNIADDYLVRIGEKYRATVSAYHFDDVPKFHITISVGAVVLPVDESFNFDHVLDLADSANRKAKAKGKDNVLLSNKNEPEA